MKVANLYLLGRRSGSIWPGRPHIWFERGYWRCSPFQKPYSEHRRWSFDQAHMFINKLNAKTKGNLK